jgi:hypothetical protein
MITQLDTFTRVITNVTDGCVMGWKYFDFGDDFIGGSMELDIKMIPRGCSGKIHIFIDSDTEGYEIGLAEFGIGDSVVTISTQLVTGRHAIYFVAEDGHTGWAKESFTGRQLFDLVSFVFRK